MLQLESSSLNKVWSFGEFLGPIPVVILAVPLMPKVLESAIVYISSSCVRLHILAVIFVRVKF